MAPNENDKRRERQSSSSKSDRNTNQKDAMKVSKKNKNSDVESASMKVKSSRDNIKNKDRAVASLGLPACPTDGTAGSSTFFVEKPSLSRKASNATTADTTAIMNDNASTSSTSSNGRVDVENKTSALRSKANDMNSGAVYAGNHGNGNNGPTDITISNNNKKECRKCTKDKATLPLTINCCRCFQPQNDENFDEEEDAMFSKWIIIAWMTMFIVVLTAVVLFPMLFYSWKATNAHDASNLGQEQYQQVSLGSSNTLQPFNNYTNTIDVLATPTTMTSSTPEDGIDIDSAPNSDNGNSISLGEYFSNARPASTSNAPSAPAPAPAPSSTEAGSDVADSSTLDSSTSAFSNQSYTPPAQGEQQDVIDTPVTNMKTTESSTTKVYNETIFYAIADIPYTITEKIMLSEYAGSIPAIQPEHTISSTPVGTPGTPSKFLVHLGDIKRGVAQDPCTEFKYREFANRLLTSPVPVFVTPGDNEVNDCDDPLEALEIFRTVFGDFEKNWDHDLQVVRQPKRAENFMFIENHILFMAVNIVGLPVFDQDEWDTRLTNQLAWVKGLIDYYYLGLLTNTTDLGVSSLDPPSLENRIQSVVLMGHSDANPNNRDFFHPLRQHIVIDWKNELPILYLHGNLHEWHYLDDPYSDGTNLLFVTLPGGLREAPLKVVVDPLNSSRNVTEGAFQLDRFWDHDNDIYSNNYRRLQQKAHLERNAYLGLEEL